MAKPYMPYDGPIVTRRDAKAAGLERYFNGKPCRNGHMSERRSSKSGCIACERVDNAARYIADPGPFKARSNTRYADKREECSAAARLYYINNCEEIKASTAEYQRLNPEKTRGWKSAWNAHHPEVRRAIKLNRRAREKAAGGSIKPSDIKIILERQLFKCAGCDTSVKKKCHIDHIMPLNLGGTGFLKNLQALCPTCNWRKSAKHPIVWAQENGRLL